jgi:hypothetical protein
MIVGVHHGVGVKIHISILMASMINTSHRWRHPDGRWRHPNDQQWHPAVGGCTLTVTGGTRTVNSGTLMVTNGTRMVDGSTLTVGGGTQMIDDQHRLDSVITGTTRLRRHQAKQRPHVC